MENKKISYEGIHVINLTFAGLPPANITELIMEEEYRHAKMNEVKKHV